MKIRLLSDLHLEHGEKNLYKSQGEDVLVLAGDIHTGANNVWTALKKFAEHQPNIVYVYGNHEFYKQDYFNVTANLETWAWNTSIHILNPGTVYYDEQTKKLTRNKSDIAFIGGTLWTNFRNDDLAKLHAKSNINDFRLIEYDNHYFSPNDAANLFWKHSQYIKEAKEDKKVIVTHFLPAIECISKQYQGPDLLNYYFANDMSNYIANLDNTLWLHGHTHDNVNIKLGNTRILANPYGYSTREYQECIIHV